MAHPRIAIRGVLLAGCLGLLTPASTMAGDVPPLPGAGEVGYEMLDLGAVMEQSTVPAVPVARASADITAEPPASPPFEPVNEDISPLTKRLVSISVRNETLRNVVKIIADTIHLNMVMEKGVNPDTPVTITLNNIPAGEALAIIFGSVDYFYEIQKNILRVKAQNTRIWEFGHPLVVNDYSLKLGGDILGGASEGTSSMTGDLNIEGKVPEDSADLWQSVSDTLARILEAEGGETNGGPAPSYSINRITGTIMVTASKSTLDRVEQVLSRIRESLNRQVLIEARILEVQLSQGLKYGIDWSFVDNVDRLGDVDVSTYNTSGASSRVKLTDVIDSTEPFLNVNISGLRFATLIRALQTQGDVNVLSNPRVSLMNGQTALLSVGRNVNFISKIDTTTASTGTTGTVNFSVETSSILSGLVIGISAYITPEGNVAMTVTPITSDLIQLEDKSLGVSGSASSLQISLPTVDLRELSTTVRARNGEMIIIGGLISTKQTEQEKGLPFLSSIPLLGYLFKSTETVDQRTELVLLLKPVVSMHN